MTDNDRAGTCPFCDVPVFLMSADGLILGIGLLAAHQYQVQQQNLETARWFDLFCLSLPARSHLNEMHIWSTEQLVVPVVCSVCGHAIWGPSKDCMKCRGKRCSARIPEPLKLLVVTTMPTQSANTSRRLIVLIPPRPQCMATLCRQVCPKPRLPITTRATIT
jgi:hypothetical protein